MKRVALIWVLYVCFAVVLLPLWMTWWMDGFAPKEEITYEEDIISTMEMEDIVAVEKNLL